MNSISRIGVIYSLIVIENEIFMEEMKRGGNLEALKGRDEEIELVIPLIFENYTKILDAVDHIFTMELYWECV